MRSLNNPIKWDTQKPDTASLDARKVATALVRQETARRIQSRWDNAGQNNVALGLHTESERLDCINWINAHRAACQAIIERDDLLGLDITDNSLWPSTD